MKNFDVLVSENGGAYLPFLTGATQTSATFNGKYGRTYRFYSLARDNAGNIEAAPDTPDATIRVKGGAFEADVANRPEGDNNGQVNAADVGQIRRFVAKLDTAFQYNEFQRADTAPREDGGDGKLSVADVIQAERFSNGSDAVAEADGPNAPASFNGAAAAKNSTVKIEAGNESPKSNRRQVRRFCRANCEPQTSAARETKSSSACKSKRRATKSGRALR